jgi:endonuclease-3
MSSELEKQAKAVHSRLKKAIPNPRVELDHADAWQLLIATILSAQSTDKKINEVTPHLFARWPTPHALAAAPIEEVEKVVKPTGFYHNKAKAIIGASRALVEHFGGVVPKKLEELITLPGVARKTANVVIGSAYGIPTGFIVDTHVARVSKRLELTIHEDPVDIERELVALFPKRSWIAMGHRLVLHGRYVCQAKQPRCGICPLNEICSVAQTKPEIRGWKERAENEQRIVESRGSIT